MIRLVGNPVMMWESQSYNHTPSHTGTLYTLNHNLGKLPDLTQQLSDYGSGNFQPVNDWMVAGSSQINYGWQTISVVDANTVTVKAYNTGTVIKFRCYRFN